MSFKSGLTEAIAIMVRNRVDALSALYFVAMLAGATFITWEYDVFHTAPHQSGRVVSLELEEALALAGVLAVSLLVFLGHFFRQRHETARRIAAEREARQLSLEDPLTGLPNRRQFEDALKTALASPPRAGASHGVFMLDLNGFKRVNDVHGHPVGDEVLIHVSGRLKNAIRDGDLVARLGGDEFAVLAPHLAGPDAATSIALRIMENLKEPIATRSLKHQIGTAIGIALTPQDGFDKAEILRKADIALYRAKGEGQSALRFFEAGMDASIRERDLLEQELRFAVSNDVLRPHYQPLIDLRTREVIGFEALARWTHPTLGEIEPNRFIPIADDCGLIGELTDRLLRRACKDAVKWPDTVTLSFNISPAQLRDQTLGLRIMGILAETGLAPARLEIEITESALVRDMDSAKTLLGALREAGVRIALDDFGTGYSSLYHLRNFKLDKIKIDRSFVESMCVDGDSAAIIKALVGLGSGLRLAVTAEGVETIEQQKMLAAYGCEQAQGFLFSRAVPAQEAAAMFVASTRAATA
jgi:diguanylate cyclase (GGDEF)-like protein